MGGLKGRDPGTSPTIPNIRLVVPTLPISGIPPMRRAFVLATALGVLGCLALMPISARSQQEGGRLPGARPTIEAIDYPSLQAAIDALPAEGGLVRLPAGTFEIKRTAPGRDRRRLHRRGRDRHAHQEHQHRRPAGAVVAPKDIDTNAAFAATGGSGSRTSASPAMKRAATASMRVGSTSCSSTGSPSASTAATASAWRTATRTRGSSTR